MDWTTVAVIAIIAFVLISLTSLFVFKSAWNKMDDTFRRF